jgi:hypothetical protein
MTVGLMGTFALLMGHSTAPVTAGEEPVAATQSMAQAWSLTQTAQLQSEQHQTQAALASFQRAYELSGDPTLLLEVGRLEHEVGNSARAAYAFQQFLERGADRVTEQRRLFAARQMRFASVGTARVKLQTNVQGASVELESQRGVATGEGFVVSVLVDAGERKLSLSKPGYETQSLTLALEPGETRSLRVDLDKAAGGRSEASPGKPRLAALAQPVSAGSAL